MKSILNILLLSIVIATLMNCEGGAGGYKSSENKQVVYFQYEYINHAWGYQHSGWLIDSSGNVYCFNNPEKWHQVDSLGLISGAQMKSNILSADSVCLIIKEEALKDKIKLIDAASSGDISNPVHKMYDAGVVVYSAFICKSGG